MTGTQAITVPGQEFVYFCFPDDRMSLGLIRAWHSQYICVLLAFTVASFQLPSSVLGFNKLPLMTGCQLQAQGYFICSVFHHQSMWQTVAGKTTANFCLFSYSHLSRKSSWINKMTQLFSSRKRFEIFFTVLWSDCKPLMMSGSKTLQSPTWSCHSGVRDVEFYVQI